MKALLALLLLFSTPSFGAYLSTSAPVTVSTTGLNSTTGVLNWDMLSNSASGWYDTLNFYGSVTFDIYTTTTVTGGVLTFEQSNDKTNDSAGVAWNVQDVTVLTQSNASALTLAASTVRHFVAPINSRYVRIRISTAFAGTGTVGVTAQFRNAAYVPLVQSINQATAGSLNMTVGSGTVTTVSTLTTAANGQTAHSSASTGSPFRIGGRVNTAVDTTLAAGDASDWFMTSSGAGVVKPYAMPEVDWQATSGTTPLATTTSTALKAAGAAGVRNYVTGCQFFNNSSTVPTTISLLDGSTVIWTGYAQIVSANLQLVPTTVSFPTPLRGTAATAMNIQLGTTAAAVYYNCQGYQAP